MARLVVTRKVGQRVVINAGGERIEVWVVRIKTSKAFSMAIEAPETVQILREELPGAKAP